MNMRYLGIVAAMGVLAASVSATTYVVDGNLSEWGAPWFTDNTEGPGTGYNDSALPVFSGYVDYDDQYLYVAMSVQDPVPVSTRGVHIYIDMPAMGVFNDPDVQHFTTNGTSTGYSYGASTPTGRNFVTAAMPAGVTIASSYSGGVGQYEFGIPLALIGAGVGDVIGLQYQATDNPSGWQYNFYPDVPAGVTPVFTSLQVEVAGLYAPYRIGPELSPTIPEPVTMAGVVLGLGALARYARRRMA